jgi:hypothetical protein
MSSEWMPECVDRYTLRLVESAGRKRWICSCETYAASGRCLHTEREMAAPRFACGEPVRSAERLALPRA